MRRVKNMIRILARHLCVDTTGTGDTETEWPACSSTEYCCLCNSKLDSSKGKRKHKKFNGSSCVMEREVIRNCMLDLDLDLSLDQTFEGNIIICYSCCLIKRSN